MRLIEKKCPNCGASLEFNENDKSCSCQYCHRSFEIERDTSLDVKDLAQQFNLSELEKPLKIFSMGFTFTYIIFFVIFILVAAGIGFGIYSTFKSSSSSKTDFPVEDIDDIFDTEDDENKLLTDVNQLSNRDFDSIDNKATVSINRRGEGINNADHSYSVNGNITREVLYVASKDDANFVIPIYKATYYDFFNQEDQYTVFIPIVFENIEKNVLFSLGNAKLSAPEFYFNDDKTSFTYGYVSIEEAYDNVIRPLENDYKITSK